MISNCARVEILSFYVLLRIRLSFPSIAWIYIENPCFYPVLLFFSCSFELCFLKHDGLISSPEICARSLIYRHCSNTSNKSCAKTNFKHSRNFVNGFGKMYSWIFRNLFHVSDESEVLPFYNTSSSASKIFTFKSKRCFHSSWAFLQTKTERFFFPSRTLIIFSRKQVPTAWHAHKTEN